MWIYTRVRFLSLLSNKKWEYLLRSNLYQYSIALWACAVLIYIFIPDYIVQSAGAGAVEYTDCTSAEG